MKNYLFVFSIGPVQSFIASARKTEDLWSGSYLLSYLAETALKSLVHEHQEMQPKLIFPLVTEKELNGTWIDEQAEVASLPNRLSFQVSAKADDQVVCLGKRLAKTVQETYQSIAKAAVEGVFEEEVARDSNIQQTASRQIEETLEIFWAFEPLGEDYAKSRKHLETNLASTKNNRFFSDNRQQGLVCTVCGEREALVEGDYKGDYPSLKKQSKRTWSNLKEKRYAKDNERLCAVCLSKRYARTYFKHQHSSFKNFPSVEDFAPDPVNYYAIIMMDGDNMGQWFSGKNIEEGQSLMDFQREISRKLGDYSKKVVPDIVKCNNGTLVYAGGDDVLSFSKLKDLLPMAKKLREAFGSERGLDPSATCSAGLLIVHKKAPLQKALNRLRALEKSAKKYQSEQQKKDAFALCVMTRGGEIRQTVLPWSLGANGEAEPSATSTVDNIIELVDLLKDQLSPTFLYHFGEAFLPLVGARKPNTPGKPVLTEDREANQRLLHTELKRVLSRSLQETNKQMNLDKQVSILLRLYNKTETLLEFIHMLEILRFLTQKEKANEEVRDGKAVH